MATSLQQRPDQESVQPVKPANIVTRYGLSYALLACLAFGAIDTLGHLLPTNKMDLPEKSTIWWATKHFQSAPARPDIVLLGSSLMIAAQNDCDATYFNHSFDAVKHYHSEYLESKLHDTTASFVIGGQMATDVYAIITTLLRNEHAPETIVWGIAPRDFVDATFSHPEETETVKLMSRISQQDNLLGLRKVPFWSRIESSLNQLSSLYGKRSQIRSAHQRSVENCLKAIAPVYYFDSMQAPAWLLHQASLSLPEDNKSGQWIVRPCNLKGPEPKDNTAEYEKRYRPFRPDLLQLQLRYYDQALKQARAQGTRVTVVNMPLTSANLALLPDGVYRNYLNSVRDMALSNDATFLDYNTDRRFEAKDFCDPVHLNGYGATKFMDQLSQSLKK